LGNVADAERLSLLKHMHAERVVQLVDLAGPQRMMLIDDGHHGVGSAFDPGDSGKAGVEQAGNDIEKTFNDIAEGEIQRRSANLRQRQNRLEHSLPNSLYRDVVQDVVSSVRPTRAKTLQSW
jgi:hypothetical protein